MKRLLTPVYLLLLLFISENLCAQLDKKTWLVGGSASFYTYNQNTVYYNSIFPPSQWKYTDIELSSTIGYFLADKTVLGLRPILSFHSGHTASGQSSNSLRYAIGPFARYYFLKAGKEFNILADACYQIGRLDFKGDGDGKMNRFSIMAGPVVFFTSSVGLEVLLGYANNIEESKGYYEDKRSGFQVSVGFQAHLFK